MAVRWGSVNGVSPIVNSASTPPLSSSAGATSATSVTVTGSRPCIRPSSARPVEAWARTPCTPAGPSRYGATWVTMYIGRVGISGGDVAVEAPAPLAGLEQPADLGHLGVDRPGEPAGGDPVVEEAERPVAEVELLHVADTGPVGHLVDLKPGVERTGHPVLERDVDVAGAAPPVPGAHRPPETAQEGAVLAGDHPVGRVGQLGHPDHLGVRLGVLGGVEDEVERLVGGHPPGHRGALAADHHRLPLAPVGPASAESTVVLPPPSRGSPLASRPGARRPGRTVGGVGRVTPPGPLLSWCPDTGSPEGSGRGHRGTGTGTWRARVGHPWRIGGDGHAAPDSSGLAGCDFGRPGIPRAVHAGRQPGC